MLQVLWLCGTEDAHAWYGTHLARQRPM